MNPLDLDKAYREALGYFEAFRKLGFAADDIYFQVGGYVDAEIMFDGLDGPVRLGPGYQVLIVLMAQERRFRVTAGIIDAATDDIRDGWTDIAQALNERRVDSEQLSAMWRACDAYRHAPKLVHALISHGFALPVAAAKLLN